jgi:phosphate/sulfate permease
MNYPNLEKFWAVQSERIETRAKLSGVQWIIIIILTIVASVYITPIGGGFVAYASYRIILHWVVSANKALNTQGDFVTISKEAGTDVAWLISTSPDGLSGLNGPNLVRASSARDAITKILTKRHADVLELEKLDPSNDKVEETKKNYEMCFEELDQINETLDPLLDEHHKIVQDEKNRQKDDEKQQAKIIQEKRVELKTQLEALEKAYNVGILTKGEYDSKKSSLNASIKNL